MINFHIITYYSQKVYCHHVIGIEEYYAGEDIADLVYDPDYEDEECASCLSFGDTIKFEDGRTIEITKDNADHVIGLVNMYLHNADVNITLAKLK